MSQLVGGGARGAGRAHAAPLRDGDDRDEHDRARHPVLVDPGEELLDRPPEQVGELDPDPESRGEPHTGQRQVGAQPHPGHARERAHGRARRDEHDEPRRLREPSLDEAHEATEVPGSGLDPLDRQGSERTAEEERRRVEQEAPRRRHRQERDGVRQRRRQQDVRAHRAHRDQHERVVVHQVERERAASGAEHPERAEHVQADTRHAPLLRARGRPAAERCRGCGVVGSRHAPPRSPDSRPAWRARRLASPYAPRR